MIDLLQMKPHIYLNSPVLHIGKKGVDNPNPINAEGIMTENEKRVADRMAFLIF